MMMTVVCLVLVGFAAVPLALGRRALEPDAKRFPCAPLIGRIILWGEAFFLFNRAAILFASVYHGDPILITWDQVVAAGGLCLTNWYFFWMLLRSSAPNGVWARVQRRLAFARAVDRDSKNSAQAAVMVAEGVPVVDILQAEGVIVFTSASLAPRDDPPILH